MTWWLGALAGAVAAVSLTIAPDSVAQAGDTVCVGKRDRTGGSLGFIVRAEDTAMFERAGFARMACPADAATRAPGLVRRCERFEAQGEIGRAAIEDLYGLSVAEMCRATRAWAASVGRGEER